MSQYSLILECWRSGQMLAAQWEEHKRDQVFAAWLRKRGCL